MAISIQNVDIHVLNMVTRFPFRYGIASLVALPHLFVRVMANIDGRKELGLASEGLPPKWFTKNPDAHFSEDLDEMLMVIRQACTFAQESKSSDTLFGFWNGVFKRQEVWGGSKGYPPLLWGFGVSLVERAVIDAFCRVKGTTFSQAVRDNCLGIDLGEIHSELSGFGPREFLPQKPNRSVIVRHTVGLTDPLIEKEILKSDRVNDGLPQSLEENIKIYGLTHLKIKLCGDVGQDLSRLKQISGLMEGQTEYAFTLDGNEQYRQIAPFRTLWESILNDVELSGFMEGLIFVEQPIQRDRALGREVKSELQAWSDRPPMIIDESDGEFSSASEALDCGYVGTSHKNCKGIFKGLANSCLMAHRRRLDPSGRYVLSSEDLANVGPVALTQDLAVIASLGIKDTERNGHHYFAGLSMYSELLQAEVLEHHGDLYRQHEKGFPTLDIKGGRIDINSVVEAPFGYGFDLDTTKLTPLSEWSNNSLEI